MVGDVDSNLANYRIPEAARALQDFVDDMSNWYVRRGRARYWAKGMEADKINAYLTLYTALVTTAKAAAPMIPFMAEDIYRNLVCSIDANAPESVHLCDFPAVDESRIDKTLEANMETVLKIVTLGRAARNGSNLKNRQPLSEMIVKAGEALPEYYVEVIEDELNVKAVEFAEDVENLVSYTFKPQLKTLGPKFGKQLGEIRTQLSALDGSAAKKELDSTGFIMLQLSTGAAQLSAEDLLIEAQQKEGYFTLSDGGVTVALNTTLTPELIREGYLREIVSKLQTMRKEAGFEVTDHINVTISGSETILAVAEENKSSILRDVLAESLSSAEPKGYVKEWDINGEAATMGVEKV